MTAYTGRNRNKKRILSHVKVGEKSRDFEMNRKKTANYKREKHQHQQ